MSRLSIGDPAPAFALEADDGTVVRLADLAGQRLVVYFYPKDDTPGCTTEACDFRDLQHDFSKDEVRILGISPDSVSSHVQFRDAHKLNFTLLSDPDHAAAEDYGVWVQKKMFGREYLGVERSTFIIGADGTIEDALYKVRPKDHAADVLQRARGRS